MSGGMGGGMGGGVLWFGRKAAAASPATPTSPAAASSFGQGVPSMSKDDSSDRDGLAERKPVQTIGEKTFYWKNDRWRDADVTAEGEKNPTRIKPFSDAYFALAAQRTADLPNTWPSTALSLSSWTARRTSSSRHREKKWPARRIDVRRARGFTPRARRNLARIATKRRDRRKSDRPKWPTGCGRALHQSTRMRR